MNPIGGKLCAAAFCAGIFAAFLLPVRGAWWLWAAGVAAAASAAFVLRGRGAAFQAACAAAALLCGTFYALWRTDAALQSQWPQVVRGAVLDVAVTGLPERDERGRVRFYGTARAQDGREYRLLLQDYGGRDWPVGSRWQVSARVRPPVGTRNPAGFDREAWALAGGTDGIASVAKTRRRLPENGFSAAAALNRLRGRITAQWQTDGQHAPQGAALMRALAVGDRSGLPPQAWAALRPLGLNHLVSISGLHVSLVAVWAAVLMKLLLRLSPVLPARPRVWTLAAGAAAALCYAALAGFEVPVVRSLLMLSVLAWAWWRRGTLSLWTAWLAALCAVLLYRPASVLAAGFWLSFGLVAVLLWTLAGRLPEKTWIQAVRGQWAATLAGGIGAVHFFGVLPVFALPVNAVAIPWFSWLLTPLALAASVLPFDGVRAWAAQIAQQTVNVLLFLADRLPETALPHAPAPLAMAAVAGAAVWLLPRGLRLRPLAACALAAWALYRPPPLSGSLRVTVWDVGQGLSVLLQTPSQNILFDTGTPAAEMSLLPNLRALGIKRLDALVLSHHDNDHDGGYPAVSAQTGIAKLWAGQPGFYRGADYCAADTRWEADGAVFEFLTPPRGFGGGNDNEESCVLRAVAQGQAVLITGDLGVRGETFLLKQYGADLFSQLLILGHHGSKTSTSGAFVNTVSPHTGVASAGFANPFGHPHPQVLAALRAHGVRVLRTDTQGALRFDAAADGWHTQILGENGKKWWHKKPFAE